MSENENIISQLNEKEREEEEQIMKRNTLKEIFPDENNEKLYNLLNESNWEIETAVLKLLDQSTNQQQQQPPQTSSSTTATRTTRTTSTISTIPISTAIHSRTPIFPTSQNQNQNQSQPPPYHSASVPNNLHNLQVSDEIKLNIKHHNRIPKRGVQKSLPAGFLEIPRVRTVIVPPLTHLECTDYLEYKVYYNRKDCTLDVNVKLIEKAIRVSGLTSSVNGEPGLSELAGVAVGDILYGVNDEYFPLDVSLQEVTTVIARSGQYVCLHFIRFQNNSLSMVCNGQVRRAGQLRKIHPCGLALIDQGLISVDDIEAFCEDLIRLKLRLFFCYFHYSWIC